MPQEIKSPEVENYDVEHPIQSSLIILQHYL